MSVTVQMNGQSYDLPTQDGAPPWGDDVTDFLRATAAGTIQRSGPLVLPFTTTSSNTTVGSSTFALSVDSSGGAVVITLPLAASNPGRIVALGRATSSANAITVQGTNSDTVIGLASIDLVTYTSASRMIILMSDGDSDWYGLAL